MDPYENNFLLAIHVADPNRAEMQPSGTASEVYHGETDSSTTISSPVGLAWLDLSTGDFFTQDTTLASLPSAIARIRAREIIIDKPWEDLKHCGLRSVLAEDRHLVTSHATSSVPFPVSEWTPMLECAIPKTVESLFTNGEVMAGGLLLNYLSTQLPGLSIKLQPPVRRQVQETMTIDRNSLRGLEILETARDGLSKGSLLHAVGRTVTKGGARLLRDRLSTLKQFLLRHSHCFTCIHWIVTCSNRGTASPSASLSIIEERLDLVSRFFVNPSLREDMVTYLRRSFDSQRLLQKFSLGRGDADDLISLSRTVEVTDQISQSLSHFCQSCDLHHDVKVGEVVCLKSILIRLNLDGPRALAHRIKEAIDEEGLFELGRSEDTDAVDMAVLAQDVLTEEGSSEDLEVLPKQMRTRVAARKAASISNRDLEDEGTWIMRQRSKQLDPEL